MQKRKRNGVAGTAAGGLAGLAPTLEKGRALDFVQVYRAKTKAVFVVASSSSWASSFRVLRAWARAHRVGEDVLRAAPFVVRAVFPGPAWPAPSSAGSLCVVPRPAWRLGAVVGLARWAWAAGALSCSVLGRPGRRRVRAPRVLFRRPRPFAPASSASLSPLLLRLGRLFPPSSRA